MWKIGMTLATKEHKTFFFISLSLLLLLLAAGYAIQPNENTYRIQSL